MNKEFKPQVKLWKTYVTNSILFIMYVTLTFIPVFIVLLFTEHLWFPEFISDFIKNSVRGSLGCRVTGPGDTWCIAAFFWFLILLAFCALVVAVIVAVWFLRDQLQVRRSRIVSVSKVILLLATISAVVYTITFFL